MSLSSLISGDLVVHLVIAFLSRIQQGRPETVLCVILNFTLGERRKEKEKSVLEERTLDYHGHTELSPACKC